MSNPNVQPIAQEFAIAAQVSDSSQYFFINPNLTQLDDGTLLIAAPHWPRQSGKGRSLRIFRSDDAGQTWDELPTMPFEEGTPFVLDGQLLMFVQEESRRDFQIVSSDDRGFTWTQPRTVLEGPIWNISTAMVTRPKRDFMEKLWSGLTETCRRWSQKLGACPMWCPDLRFHLS